MSMYTRENSKKNIDVIEQEDLFVTLSGNEEYKTNEGFPCVHSEENKNVLAKRKNNRSFILKSSNGLFNPLDAYGQNDPNKTRNGIKIWEFKEVKPTAFYYYCRFLSTRNQAWLLRAQREV